MAATVSPEAPPDLDQRIVLRDVSWEQYEALLALFGDDPPGIRMAYLEGALEIISPRESTRPSRRWWAGWSSSTPSSEVSR